MIRSSAIQYDMYVWLIMDSFPLYWRRCIVGNGLQGFQTPIANDSFIVDGVGALGTAHTERGLTYVEVALSGHMWVQWRMSSCLLDIDVIQGTAIFASGQYQVNLWLEFDTDVFD